MQALMALSKKICTLVSLAPGALLAISYTKMWLHVCGKDVNLGAPKVKSEKQF